MKNLWLLPIFLFLLNNAVAQEWDIPEEVQPSQTKARIKFVRIMPNAKTVSIVIEKGYVDGKFINIKERSFIFRDIEDNLETPEDETDTSYTDFMTAIEINKVALRDFIKSRW